MANPMPATFTDPYTGEKLVRTEMDGVTKACARCLATHGYWLAGKCQICALHDQGKRERKRYQTANYTRADAEQN